MEGSRGKVQSNHSSQSRVRSEHLLVGQLNDTSIVVDSCGLMKLCRHSTLYNKDVIDLSVNVCTSDPQRNLGRSFSV